MKIGLKEIYEKVEKVELILVGNGKEGLCETVRKHNDRIRAIEGKPFKRKEWLIFLIIGGTFIITLLKSFDVIK